MAEVEALAKDGRELQANGVAVQTGCSGTCTKETEGKPLPTVQTCRWSSTTWARRASPRPPRAAHSARRRAGCALTRGAGSSSTKISPAATRLADRVGTVPAGARDDPRDGGTGERGQVGGHVQESTADVQALAARHAAARRDDEVDGGSRRRDHQRQPAAHVDRIQEPPDRPVDDQYADDQRRDPLACAARISPGDPNVQRPRAGKAYVARAESQRRRGRRRWHVARISKARQTSGERGRRPSATISRGSASGRSREDGARSCARAGGSSAHSGSTIRSGGVGCS